MCSSEENVPASSGPLWGRLSAGSLPCRSEEKLRAARAQLGQAAVHLIRINSGGGDPAAVLGYERIWRPPLPGCLPSGGAGEPPSRPPVPPAVCHPTGALSDICSLPSL